MYTPWGRSDSSKKIIRGLIFYSTPSHGGYHVSATLLKEMPEVFRKKDGWYEEDCESALVILSFQKYFTNQEIDSAVRTAKDYFPHEYIAWGKSCGLNWKIHPDESLKLREEKATRANWRKFVVNSAWGDWHKQVPEGKVGVFAVRASPHEEGWFLVSADEYGNREGVFVVNPDIHELWDKHP